MNMKIVLINPEFTETYWSFKHALKFISRQASCPPLALLTVAALLPQSWEKKLYDLNVNSVSDQDIKDADYVMLSAMSVQRQSAETIIARCKKFGRRIIAGGPLFASEFKSFPQVDALVLNEAEISMPQLIKDMEQGELEHIYSSPGFADLTAAPEPAWELIDLKNYASMCIQYSRGCPFTCEFCDVAHFYGKNIRVKKTSQVLAELDSLYQKGWRGNIFIVDSNFIGHKIAVKSSLLPALTAWLERRKHPFTFNAQTSLNLADDDKLMSDMVKAGFNSVF